MTPLRVTPRYMDNQIVSASILILTNLVLKGIHCCQHEASLKQIPVACVAKIWLRISRLIGTIRQTAHTLESHI